jgi:hypothetical protein
MTENIQDAINAWALHTLKIKSNEYNLHHPPSSIEFEFSTPIAATPEQIEIARQYVTDYVNNTLLKAFVVKTAPLP